jgi:hypothetical protein
MLQEEWRPVPVPGYGDFYEVSNLGRVRSWKVKKYPHRRAASPKVIKPNVLASGYRVAHLQHDGQLECRTVHSMVLEAFVGPRPDGTEVCHNDGDPGNNSLGNLRYDTPAANQADRVLHGTDIRGEDHVLAKLTEPDVLEIRRRHQAGESIKSLARIFPVGTTQIARIIKRESWAHI